MSDRTGNFYAADDALVGYGTQWLVGNGASPETFEAVAGVISFEAGSSARSAIDRTHLRSPGRHREVMPGIASAAPFSGQLIWLPYEQSQSYAGGGSGSFASGGLPKLAENGTIRNMKLRYYDGVSPSTELDFTGFIMEFTPSAGVTVDDKLTVKISVQPTEAFLSGLPA